MRWFRNGDLEDGRRWPMWSSCFIITGNSNLKNPKTDYDWRVGQMLEATVWRHQEWGQGRKLGTDCDLAGQSEDANFGAEQTGKQLWARGGRGTSLWRLLWNHSHYDAQQAEVTRRCLACARHEPRLWRPAAQFLWVFAGVWLLWRHKWIGRDSHKM